MTKTREKVSSVETHQTSSSTILTSAAAKMIPKSKVLSSSSIPAVDIQAGDRQRFETRIG